MTRHGASRKARLVIWPLVVLVFTHTFFILLWVAPTNPIKEAVGADRVSSYIMPMLQQNWSIFAPTPRRVAVELDFRARLLDPDTGEGTTTEWMSFIDAEDELVRHNFFPPRTALAARRAANHLNNAMVKMNTDQRERIGWGYFDTPISELRDELLAVDGDEPANASTVDTYLSYDAVAVGLASYSAHALWDEEVVRVQYRTSKRYVPAFEDRAERDIDDAERTWYEYGWRAAEPITSEQSALFTTYAQLIAEAE